MEYFKDQFSTGHLDVNGNKAITATQTSLIVAILSVGTVLGMNHAYSI